jgi:hypothetical protein
MRASSLESDIAYRQHAVGKDGLQLFLGFDVESK